MKLTVPFAGRCYDEKEVMAAVKASIDFWLTAGPETKRFEHGLCAVTEARHALFVNSGSSAILCALAALSEKFKLKRGDRIATTALGFPTTVAPIIQQGYVPVFVDVDSITANVNPEMLKEAVEKYDCKGAVLAHTLGVMFDVRAVRDALGEERFLLEDACDALGSKLLYADHNYVAGSVGDAAALSFYPAHHITTGEGGAVLTSNDEIYEIARSYRDWGRDCSCNTGQDNKCGKRFDGQWGDLPKGYDHKYVYSRLGYNLKATDIQAAIGNVQLTKLYDFTQKRRANRKALYDALKHYEDRHVHIQMERCNTSKFAEGIPSWFGFMMTVRKGASFTRDEIVRYLTEEGIQVRFPFAGNMMRQPAFASLEEGKDYIEHGFSVNTDEFCENSFFVGVWQGMSAGQLGYMIDTLKKFFDRYG